MARQPRSGAALTRRKALTLSTAAAAGLYLARESRSARAAETPTEIRLFDYKLTEIGAKEVLRKLVADFEKQHPSVKVKLEEVSWPDHFKKLIILVQGGNPPDLVRIADTDIFPLAGIGALSPITDWIEKNDKADTTLAQLPAAVRTSLRYKGADVFMPMAATGFDILAWNKNYFQSAGLDPEKPPATWSELVSTAKKLTDPSRDRYGWAAVSDRSNSTSRRVIRWIVSGGGEIFSDDGTEFVANNPEGLKGYQFWADLALKHKVVPPGSINVPIRDVLNMYGQGRIGMYDTGPNTIKIADVDFPGNVAKTQMGAMPDPWRPPLLCAGFAVMNASKKKEAAALLASFLTTANSQVEYAIGSYEVPIRADAALDPRLKAHPFLATAVALTKRGVPNPGLHVKYAEIEDRLFDAIQATLSGAKTPKQALDDMAIEADKILKRWKEKLAGSR